jgi:hypothetical protein
MNYNLPFSPAYLPIIGTDLPFGPSLSLAQRALNLAAFIALKYLIP